MVTNKPTKTQATDAARSFLRHRETLGAWQTADLLMGLGRHYEFPPATPKFAGKLAIGPIAEFIQQHAVEIE
jgi:hypothetical protein